MVAAPKISGSEGESILRILPRHGEGPIVRRTMVAYTHPKNFGPYDFRRQAPNVRTGLDTLLEQVKFG